LYISDLRASLSGKGVPEDIQARLLAMHEENVAAKEQLKTAQEKLVKARAVCAMSWQPTLVIPDIPFVVH